MALPASHGEHRSCQNALQKREKKAKNPQNEQIEVGVGLNLYSEAPSGFGFILGVSWG